MKFFLITIIYFIGAFSHPAFGQVKKEEINYIYKDSIKGFSQSIFFETNKQSKFYKNIKSFTLSDFDKDSYINSLKYLRLNEISLTKRKTIVPSKEWIILKKYKGKFYAYHPCDFYHFYKVSINDSTYIDWTGEGALANRILSQSQINDSTFEVSTTGILVKYRTIRITLIDTARGIAIFEELTRNKLPKYFLMIRADKIESVGFIVNNCETEKQFELDFERPDFNKLLQDKL